MKGAARIGGNTADQGAEGGERVGQPDLAIVKRRARSGRLCISMLAPPRHNPAPMQSPGIFASHHVLDAILKIIEAGAADHRDGLERPDAPLEALGALLLHGPRQHDPAPPEAALEGPLMRTPGATDGYEIVGRRAEFAQQGALE